MLKMQQDDEKEYGVQKLSISGMQSGLTKQKRMPFEKQKTVKITKDDVKRNLKSMPDWKVAGPDKIRGFWLKSFTAVCKVLDTVLNECIEVGDVPGWLVEGRTILVMREGY